MRVLHNVILIGLAVFEVGALAQQKCIISKIDVLGANRTDQHWIIDYLNVDLPVESDQIDTVGLRQKLMTTDIFTAVDVSVKEHLHDKSHCSLLVDISEKWTFIPVIRGVYGGGTPLSVLGAYETNAFGQNKLIGGEMQRYGNMPPGFLLYGKSPHAWRGTGSYGGEFYLERRRRAFFDQEGTLTSYADSEANTAKFRLLLPVPIHFLPESIASHLQLGLHAEVRLERPTQLKDKNLEPLSSRVVNGLTMTDQPERSLLVAPMVVFDDVNVHLLEEDGLRVTSKIGVQHMESHAPSTASETEIFAYRIMGGGLNFASHFFYGDQNRKTLRNVYFLGGFDSVRGLPDGIHFGTKILFANFEARHMTAKFKRLHVQSAIFTDMGSASDDRQALSLRQETSLGLGLRLSVPQVYRLLLRVDYAKSIGRTECQGFSVGLGQFFQPYKLVY
jgi:outer membrane protein assembly factor BamA